MSETYLIPQQRNKSRGSRTWHGGIVRNGVTQWVSLKTEKQAVAMEWYNKMQAGRFAPREEKIPCIPIGKAMDAYLDDVENVRRNAAGTVSEYRKHLGLFLRWCIHKGIAAMGDLTPLAYSGYAGDELARLSGNRAKTRIAVLRSFFRWTAESRGLEMRNPFKGIKISSPKPEPRKFWTVEECERVIAAADGEEHRCWFALMAYAGLRREEARMLAMENLAGGRISLVGKGGKHATLPISSRLKEYLNRYLVLRGDAPGFLFPELAKSCGNFFRCVRAAAAKAGVTNADTAHCHRFRHSFASNLIRMSRNIKAVQMLMRHENVTLTLNTYGHLLPSDLEKEVEL